MGLIYSRAQEVWAWLGNDGVIAEMLLTLPRHSLERGRFNDAGNWTRDSYPCFDQDWGQVCQRSFWKRAWITQEISLAREVRLLGGSAELELDECYLPETQNAHVPLLAKARYISPESDSLLSLLRHFHTQECKIQRDIVFSLLAMCIEGPNIDVDYTVSDTEVLFQVLNACAQRICTCSVYIVARALKVDQILDNGIGVHGFEFHGLKFTDNPPTPKAYYVVANSPSLGSTKCPTCFEPPWDATHLPTLHLCFRNLCPFFHGHLFWSEPTLPGGQPTCSLSSNFLMNGYSVRWTADSQPVPVSINRDFCLRLPLRFLMEGFGGPDILRSTDEFLDYHMNSTKGLVKFYTPTDKPPAQLCIIVE